MRPTDEIVSEPISSSGITAALCPDIQAENALLVSEDEPYFARCLRVKIASITKVMTAIVALENASLDTVVTVDEEAATVGESSAGLQGDSMDLQTALYALMVPSGNDAAVAIAKCVGPLLPSYDGTNALEVFVAAMNEKAEELGCSDTLYSNPHGLDADGYESDAHSTAADVGIVVSYAMENDLFREIVDAETRRFTCRTRRVKIGKSTSCPPMSSSASTRGSAE
ncbi:MAG: D-alanyl-D-alanine carboxypeptidase family protein [Eggerthellaceae bacterium]